MRKLIVVLLTVALFMPGCARGMVRAAAIQPAVNSTVADYVILKTEQARKVPLPDENWKKKVALAVELKATVDLAAGGE